MRVFNNIVLVIFILVGAYGIYTNWSIRTFIAFCFVGVAIELLFKTISPEKE